MADSKLFNVRSLATGVGGLDLAEAPLGMHSMAKQSDELRRNQRCNLSSVIGRSRTRFPVAW
jgi:hypothetical protein